MYGSVPPPSAVPLEMYGSVPSPSAVPLLVYVSVPSPSGVPLLVYGSVYTVAVSCSTVPIKTFVPRGQAMLLDLIKSIFKSEEKGTEEQFVNIFLKS